MELNKQNLELVKELLDDKIYSHMKNILYLKQEIQRNTPTESCKFRLSESMQIKHDNNKKAFIKTGNQLEECKNLLNQVLAALESKKNCEGTFITGLHD